MSQETSGHVIADRRFEMAQHLASRGELLEATELLEQTVELVPEWAVLHFRLGEFYMMLERRDEALKAFTSCLAIDPDDRLGAIIKLSLLGASPRPQTLPTGYVEALFDDYADRFDQALLENLGYRVPWIIADAIEKVRPYAEDTAEIILDLGCGTGLGGEAIAKRASWLEGVDMSAGMLTQADQKRIYHHTEHSEAVSYLLQCEKHFDVIMAADVLVYMGDLEDLFLAVSKRLSSWGLFAFSTQILESGTYMLGGDHRYAHSAAYIESCAAGAGLKVLHMERSFIRHDGHSDIYGQVAVLGKVHQDAVSTPLFLTSPKRDRVGE
ncbi:MAG: methyltransferase domain-containing protein [Alphaproteobacteria bacterium]|nr:methyltransferase domain-containing protein [Alphaproteobacteria bacterium]